MSAPPHAPPGPPQLLLAGDQLTVSWPQATRGGAPIAGYTLCYGPIGGPYANRITCPISVHPIAQNSVYSYTFEHGAFAFASETYEFVVQTYDDGTAS